ITEVIEDPIVRPGMRREPSQRPDRKVGRHPRIGQFRLVDDDFDLVMGGEVAQQTGAVVGNTRAYRWQRRHMEETWSRALRTPAGQPAPRMVLDGRQRLARADRPGEPPGLYAGMRTQPREKILIRKRRLQLGRDRAATAWIEQRILATDYLRQAGGVRADHRRAAGHRLQQRQAQALVQ